MARRISAFPRRASSVVPLGIDMSGYQAHRARPSGPFRIGYFARIAPEKGLHVLAQAYVRLRQRTGAAPAARSRRLPGAGPRRPICVTRRVSLERGGLGRRVRLSRRARSRWQAELPARSRRAVGAGDLRRAQGDVPARSDGQRRAGRAAATRRVHRSRGEDGGGLLVEPDDPRAGRRSLPLWRDPRSAAALGAARVRGRARALYDSTVGRRGCSRSTARWTRQPP